MNVQKISAKSSPKKGLKKKRPARKRKPRTKHTDASYQGAINLPASFAKAYDTPIRWNIGKAPTHEEWGEGIRVNGIGVVTSVTSAVGNAQLFAGFAATDYNGINKIGLHPYALTTDGRLYSIASTYSRYACRRCKLDYRTASSTSVNGQMAVGYSSDPGSVFETTYGFTNTSVLDPNVVSPYWAPWCLEMKYGGSMTWYTDNLAASGEVDARVGIQGTFVGYPSANGTLIIGYGEIVALYTFDFYSPVPTEGTPSLLGFPRVDQRLFWSTVQPVVERIREYRKKVTLDAAAKLAVSQGPSLTDLSKFLVNSLEVDCAESMDSYGKLSPDQEESISNPSPSRRRERKTQRS
jgi:hypothetical protein